MKSSERRRTRRSSLVINTLLLSSAALWPVMAPAMAQDAEEEITVTAQRRSESIQKVPIAVSAFSEDSLQKQKLDGGPDLVKAIPNVTFAKGNFTGSNFQIRGIGSKLVAASGDSATGIHLNNAPLTANNLFETDFYDTERVEVLRGPQGTLYGRNATGGVLNVITAKPDFEVFDASARFEYGNFNSIKARGMVNVPLGEMFSLRLAGFYTKRDGFGDNLTTGNDVDDRDIYGTRATLGFKPDDSFTAYLMWDHFDEDDSRSRIGKQLCSKDNGPAQVGTEQFSPVGLFSTIQRGFFTQGCRATQANADDILGTINSQATLGGLFGLLSGAQTGDAFAGQMQDEDIRNIEAFLDPIYQSKTDIYELILDWDVSENVRLSSLTSYTEFELFTKQDYNRYVPVVGFNATPNPVNVFAAVPGYASGIYPTVFPNGIPQDPQTGNRDRFSAIDISSNESSQFTQEFRVQTSFDGPVNFSLGANYLRFNSDNRYYVMFNTGTSYYQINNILQTGTGNCGANVANCIFVDPDPNGANRQGHNYYLSYSPYNLQSTAIFGEVYWNVTEDFKITGGVRYTDDDKEVISYPVALGVVGSGDLTPINQRVSFGKMTGRLGFDWTPDLDFTDSTLIYGFYSRGYKAGGLNSPCTAGAGVICGKPDFDPEFINSYEIGFKNTLADGSLQLNLSAFMYDYQGYQVSKIVNRASTNENIDAEIRGAEFESIWSPLEGFRLNANVGYLDTEITSGLSVDTFNRTQGDPNLIVVKSSAASNCVVSVATAQAALAAANATNPFALLGMCAGAFGAAFDGVEVNLEGNQLPNAPHWTISLGAQYSFEIAEEWEFTLRADYYRQTESFTRIYNSQADKLEAWDNLNFTATLANASNGWQVDAFVKNALDEDSLVDTYLTDDSSGLFRNGFYNDPRTFGLAVSYRYTEAEAEVMPVEAPPPAPVAAKTFIVFFDFNRSDLTPEANAVLAEAAAAYKSTGSVSIAVIGHTDTVGSATYNQALSERRADSVKSGLVANGVAGDTISTSGRGFADPLVPTGPGVKEPQNRRATIDLTGSGT